MSKESGARHVVPGCDSNELATLIGASVGGGEVACRVVVVPWGEVDSTAGRFIVDEESGRLVVEAFAEHGTDLPIDYEHQTLGGSFASPRGTAPAAGWIKALEAAAGEGIVATVSWTEEAGKMLAAKEYRYLSPVAIVRKSDRKLVALHSAALTNKPAIVGMAAIVNQEPAASDDAGEEGVAALCKKLKVEKGEGLEQVLVAATARIEALETESNRRDAEALVAAAQAEGKLTAPQQGWALRMALQQRALFEEWGRTAPIVVATGRLEPPRSSPGAPAGAQAVSERARSEYRACKQLQAVTSEEAYVADALRHREG